MKILIFNGSFRKKGNTASLLHSAIEGAISKGAETELINLYDLNFKGCRGCNACKTITGKSYGKCIIDDDLKPIFKKIEEADAVIFGSPIYLGRESGVMQTFLERLLFQYLVYKDPKNSLFPKKINTAFIYSMNLTEDLMKTYGIDKNLSLSQYSLKYTFGSLEILYSFDTLPTNNYSEVMAFGDQELKLKRHKEDFPKDCEKAFELGEKLATDMII